MEDEQYKTTGSRTRANLFDCPESFAKWYCLNGATCFMVKVRNSSLYNCWCRDGFHGLRCDYKYVSHHPETLETVGQTHEGHSHFSFIRSSQSADTLSENLMLGHEAMTNPSHLYQSSLMIYYVPLAVGLLLLFLLLLMVLILER